MMKISISVVIVTYNSVGIIDECLNSLYKYNDVGEELEVIVVDNCSCDYCDLKKILQKYPNVKLFKNNINGGYGQGNNLGINNATGDIICIMNPDVRCVNGIFKRAKKVFSSLDIVLLGMKQIDKYYNRSNSYGLDLPYLNFLMQLMIIKIANHIDYFNSRYMFISGACFFIRKSYFQNIGMFDENFFMYREECDIKRRICEVYSNKSIVYDKSMNYIHDHSTSKFVFDVFKRKMDSMLYFCDKYSLKSKKVLKQLYLNSYLFYYISRIRKDEDSCAEYIKAIEWLSDALNK